MIKRIIEISNPAYLSSKDNQLIIKQDEEISIPLEDIGVIVIDSLQITFSNYLMIACAKYEITILSCDEKHLPYGIYHSLVGHTQFAKIIKTQINISLPNKKQLWKMIINEKIENQKNVLKHFGKDFFQIEALQKKLKSGDKENIEGQVASIYWKNLFGDSFLRERGEEGINSFLNYGYAIIRAAIARSVVSSGLHPSLGIFHKNQFNAFNLVDDLIEPFRPLVDKKIYEIISLNKQNTLDFTPNIKREILEVLTQEVLWDKGKLPILVSFSYYTASFKEALEDSNKLLIPKIFFS